MNLHDGTKNHDRLDSTDVAWYVMGNRLEELLYELDTKNDGFKGIYDLYLKEKEKQTR